MSRKIIAYDLGTGGIKASLYDERGKSLSNVFEAYPTYYPSSNMQEQRPQDWWKGIMNTTSRLIESSGVDASQIEVLAISGHSLGVVLLGEDGELLCENTPIWSDKRATLQAERFFKTIDYKEWYMQTGNGFPAECYSVFKIMWYADNMNDVYDRAYKVVGTKDYCNFKFTGKIATDPSYASGSGLFDLASWSYDEKLVAASGIRDSLLPSIVASDSVIGTLTSEAAQECGLPQSVKVICGGVDNSCMALGARGTVDSRVYTSLGSSAWIALTSKKAIVDFEYKPYVFAHVLEGMYNSATCIFSAGTSFRWIRDQFCSEIAQMDNCYDLMCDMAESSPVGAKGLLFNPSLCGGSMSEPSSNICGSLSAINISHTRSDIIRSAMEGIALNLRLSFDILRRYHADIDKMLIVGGGSKSSLWRQIFADCYGVSILKSCVDQDAASLGAAALAAKGAGIWSDYSLLDSLHIIEDCKDPIPENEARYEQILPLFKRLAKDMSDLGDAISGSI